MATFVQRFTSIKADNKYFDSKINKGSTAVDGYQSLRLLQLGLERFKPPRRRGGKTRPLMMVFSTIESTS